MFFVAEGDGGGSGGDGLVVAVWLLGWRWKTESVIVLVFYLVLWW